METGKAKGFDWHRKLWCGRAFGVKTVEYSTRKRIRVANVAVVVDVATVSSSSATRPSDSYYRPLP
jgi:hypothetical protein